MSEVHEDFRCTIWTCNSCGYRDVVRKDNDPRCGGCGKVTDGTTMEMIWTGAIPDPEAERKAFLRDHGQPVAPAK